MMLHYICIELFEERTLSNIEERLSDPTLADNRGDGIIEYALSWHLSLADADRAVGVGYHDLRMIGLTRDRLPNIISPLNPVIIDDDVERWYGRRLQIFNIATMPWRMADLVHAIVAYRRYWSSVMYTTADIDIEEDYACRLLSACDIYQSERLPREVPIHIDEITYY